MIRTNMATQQFFSVFVELFHGLQALAKVPVLSKFIQPSADDGTDIGTVLGVSQPLLFILLGTKSSNSIQGPWKINQFYLFKGMHP